MKTTKMRKYSLLGVGGMLLAFNLTLRADPLVPNGDFEDAPASPYVLSGGTVATTSSPSVHQFLTDFTISIPGQGAVDLANVKQNNVFGFATTPGADTGLGTTANQQVFEIQESGLAQSVSVTTASGLATLSAGTTYKASIEAANANQYDSALGNITLSFVDLTTGTVLGTPTVVTKSSLGLAGFTVIPLSFTSSVTSSDEVGIKVNLINTALGSSSTPAWNPYSVVGFDNLTFSATAPAVPEPSTYVLMGFGLASLLAVQRFRRLA